MTTPPFETADYWKRKLAAFLHDSPSKCLDIRHHEERSELALHRAGLSGWMQTFKAEDRAADWIASAADRLPFPSNQGTVRIRSRYDGVANRFRHPLSPGCTIPAASRPLNATDAEEVESLLQPQVLLEDAEEDSAAYWRAVYFAHWRLWRRNVSEHDTDLAFLPADTRIPDHTIWHHMSAVSALQTAGTHPAFLKLQLSPVQDFIAAARSTRDLWSGSYLLSWLMATALAELARRIGPDTVIFPSLYGQPVFDLQFRDELWRKLRQQTANRADTVWDSLDYHPHALLTPNLPNVLFAIVPAGEEGSQLANHLVASIRREWRLIAEHVLEFSRPLFAFGHVPPDYEKRFWHQVDHHWDIAWHLTPWPATPEDARAAASRLLPGGPSNTTVERFDRIHHFFTNAMPKEDRDGRYYIGGKDGPKDKLNSVGCTWSLLYALNSWALDATRQTRAFGAWNIPDEKLVGGCTKDALTGREEMIAGGKAWHDALDEELKPRIGEKTWKKLFPHSDEFGALTLIKRVWHLAYLVYEKCIREAEPGDPNQHLNMPNTYDIARGEKEETDNKPGNSDEGGPYFAVLALDGDSIGEIVSGERTPKVGTQLSDYTDDEGRKGASMYFEQEHLRALLEVRRPLHPAYHLQFSEALGNFALLCAPVIVEAHKGKLIYSGGDDVLAMVPATEAIACADALQCAFRGMPLGKSYELPRLGKLLHEGTAGSHEHNGFYRLEPVAPQGKSRDPFRFIVPGPSCTASVGIAIAHYKAPLQDVVREAQSAQKRAKDLAKSDPAKVKHAIAVSVFKRSGEITEWSARFDDHAPGCTTSAHRGAIPALAHLRHCLDQELVSAKFPHRLIERLEAYLPNRVGSTAKAAAPAAGFDPLAILEQELDHVISRQSGEPSHAEVQALQEALLAYARTIPPTKKNPLLRYESVIGLCTVGAFLRRIED